MRITPEITSADLMTGSGSTYGPMELAKNRISRGCVHNQPQWGSGIAGHAP